ncbi:MAG: hypothetical protein ACPG4Y_09405, partial [Chitinophagales bacterium]
MAIHQFYLACIPKKGIVNFFGKIPNRITLDDFNKYRLSSDKKTQDEFDEFESIHHPCWEIAKINSLEIISQLDNLLDKASWANDEFSFNWKSETIKEDNDCWIFCNKQKE